MKRILQDIFYERLNEIYFKNELKIIENGFSTIKKPVYFRVNTLKGNSEIVEVELKENKLEFEKLDFLDNSYKLINGKERDLWDLEIYKSGIIYLQSISSQIPVNLFDKKIFDKLGKDIKILDLASAPGGKTSQLSELTKNKGDIIACELSSIRIDKMNYNFKKLGVKNVKIVSGDSKKSLEEYRDNYFDIILFDTPCSGEGIINYNKEKSYIGWDLKHIKSNYKLQKEILGNNLRLLKKDGEFIYSTCTLSPEENEGIVHFLLCNFPELKIQDINIDHKYKKKGIKTFGKFIYRNEVEKSMRILPSEENDGFFVTKFKKI